MKRNMRYLNVFMQLSWRHNAADRVEKAQTPLIFEEHRFCIAWPPPCGGHGYLVFEHAPD